MYLLGLLFRVWEHGVMMCCGNVISSRFCFILKKNVSWFRSLQEFSDNHLLIQSVFGLIEMSLSIVMWDK